MFDKEEYWKRRKAKKSGTPTPPKPRVKTPHEWQAEKYHERVMKAVKDGHITEEQAREELNDAADIAFKNMKKIGASDMFCAIIENVILHGSLEKANSLNK